MILTHSAWLILAGDTPQFVQKPLDGVTSQLLRNGGLEKL